MDGLESGAMVFAGFVAGVTVGWTLLKSRFRRAAENAENKAELKCTALLERLQSKEERVHDLQLALKKSDSEVSCLRDELKWEMEKRQAAVQKNTRIPELDSLLKAKEEQIADLQKRIANACALKIKLEEENNSHKRQAAFFKEGRQKLVDTFKAVAADVLQVNNRSFIDLAKNTLEKFQEGARDDLKSRQQAIADLIDPLQKSLGKVDDKLEEMEKERGMAYVSLSEQIKSLALAQSLLQKETGKLVKALRSPTVRGRWGEIQLKRVVEIAGMVERCDFLQQESAATEDGYLRPDMIIKLPNDRNVVVDSKAPLQAYLQALETDDQAMRIEKLKEHARHIRTHLLQLGSKSYWAQFQPAPEFAVLFLPGESFFSAALEQDPELIEFGVDNRVILATPTTLIALLRAVAYGWRQEKVTRYARVISDLGKSLYDRIFTLTGYFGDIRKGLDRSVDAYNKAVGSMEARVLVTARKFKDLGASTGDDIPEIERIERVCRILQPDELPLFSEDDDENRRGE